MYMHGGYVQPPMMGSQPMPEGHMMMNPQMSHYPQQQYYSHSPMMEGHMNPQQMGHQQMNQGQYMQPGQPMLYKQSHSYSHPGYQ